MPIRCASARKQKLTKPKLVWQSPRVTFHTWNGDLGDVTEWPKEPLHIIPGCVVRQIRDAQRGGFFVRLWRLGDFAYCIPSQLDLPRHAEDANCAIVGLWAVLEISGR